MGRERKEIHFIISTFSIEYLIIIFFWFGFSIVTLICQVDDIFIGFPLFLEPSVRCYGSILEQRLNLCPPGCCSQKEER